MEREGISVLIGGGILTGDLLLVDDVRVKERRVAKLAKREALLSSELSDGLRKRRLSARLIGDPVDDSRNAEGRR